MTVRGFVYVVWVCPKCGWAPDDPKQKWTGYCAAGHDRAALVKRRAVLV
jgi:hypothetical protein